MPGDYHAFQHVLKARPCCRWHLASASPSQTADLPHDSQLMHPHPIIPVSTSETQFHRKDLFWADPAFPMLAHRRTPSARLAALLTPPTSIESSVTVSILAQPVDMIKAKE